jgi:hypothetical protein
MPKLLAKNATGITHKVKDTFEYLWAVSTAYQKTPKGKQ